MGYIKLWVEEKLWMWDEVKDGLKERQGEEEGKKEVRERREREKVFVRKGKGRE